MPIAKVWVSRAFCQLVLGEQLLAQVAARAFGEDRVLAAQFHAELEVLAGSPSFVMPMLPVATPATHPCSSYSTSAAAKPGKISTPSASACCAIHLTTFDRLTT
jgi:hypothetical protein